MHSDVGLTGKNRLDTLSDVTLAARAEHPVAAPVSARKRLRLRRLRPAAVGVRTYAFSAHQVLDLALLEGRVFRGGRLRLLQ